MDQHDERDAKGGPRERKGCPPAVTHAPSDAGSRRKVPRPLPNETALPLARSDRLVRGDALATAVLQSA